MSRARRTPSELLALTANGDRVAFRELYEELRAPVMRQVCRSLAGSDEIREVVYGTFVEVWWMARFHAADSAEVMPWVLDIACRRAEECARTRSPADAGATNRVLLETLLRSR
ncbi:hypothetical protein [Actinoplanes cyaneus]|uniref:hypothetical protein n=1 Tax=Actinoplanes cyaneus TaxID=52696 RepID=UPI0019428931|nr:hypothetical protein [Actinoplanes cyaneus]